MSNDPTGLCLGSPCERMLGFGWATRATRRCTWQPCMRIRTSPGRSASKAVRFFFWMGQRAEIKNATQQNPPKRLGGAMSGRRQAHVKRGPFSQALTERLLQHLDCRALSHQSGAKIPQTDRRVVRSQRNGPRAPRVRTDRSRPVTIDKQVAVCRICRKQSAVPTHHALKTTPRKSHSLAKTQIQQR